MPHTSNDIQTWFSHVRERISLSGPSTTSTSNTSLDHILNNISSIIHNAQYDQLLPFCQDVFNSIKTDAEMGTAIGREDVCHVLPSLIYAYLSLYQTVVDDNNLDNSTATASGGTAPTPGGVRHGKRRAQKQTAVDMLQTVLLAVYNLCAASRTAGAIEGHATMFARPSLEVNSIFHASSSYLPSAKVSASNQGAPDLYLQGGVGGSIMDSSGYGKGVAASLQDSPKDIFPIYETMNSDNMWIILCANVALYNNSLHLHSRLSFTIYCQLVEFLVSLNPKSSRIPCINESFVIELVTGLYFYMFNKGVSEALRALRVIELRATYDSMCNVLLIINSIRNSLETNPSGHPHDGPVGLREVAYTTIDNFSISKSGTSHPLTNATFQTSKLPDDISPEEVKIVDKKMVTATTVLPLPTNKANFSTIKEIASETTLPSVPPFYDPTVKKVTTKDRSWMHRYKHINNGNGSKIDGVNGELSDSTDDYKQPLKDNSRV